MAWSVRSAGGRSLCVLKLLGLSGLAGAAASGWALGFGWGAGGAILAGWLGGPCLVAALTALVVRRERAGGPMGDMRALPPDGSVADFSAYARARQGPEGPPPPPAA